jgi:hypothetical protein
MTTNDSGPNPPADRPEPGFSREREFDRDRGIDRPADADAADEALEAEERDVRPVRYEPDGVEEEATDLDEGE